MIGAIASTTTCEKTAATVVSSVRLNGTDPRTLFNSQ